MSTDTIKIKAKFVKEDSSEMSKASVEFAVPKIWWQTLSLKHRNTLALEYMTNQLFSGITYLPTGTKVELEEKKEDKKQEADKQDSSSKPVQPPVATTDPKTDSSTTQTEKAHESGSESQQTTPEKKEEPTQSEDSGKQNVDKQDKGTTD